jgi:iron(III) transport system substrate-binding protein
MISRRSFALGGAAASSLASVGAAAGVVPGGYPRSYARLIDAARREGQLTVYTAIEEHEVDDVLRDFRSRYPFIKVDYDHIHSTALYDRFVREVQAGQPSADLLVSSAMDTQIKLVNDGYAQAYASPEKPSLPAWASWKDQAYGVTAEPIVFAYNKTLMPVSDVPQSHDGLERLLRRSQAAYRGKIATYDPEHSATGYLFFTQDLEISHDTWALVRAFGRTKAALYVSGDQLLNDVISGKFTFSYNMISSYALEKQATHPVLGIVFPSDYTLIMSRIAFITKDARHPAAAKLFLDHLLSRRGQTLLASRHMAPVRDDVPHPVPAGDPATRQAIHVGPSLLANLDQLRRERVLQQWRAAVNTG